MAQQRKARSALVPMPMLSQETLYVGVDIGKFRHVAGFLSRTLLARHGRFEGCPTFAFDQSREGFRSLVDRIREFVPLEQVMVLFEHTGHYHRLLEQYLLELDITVYRVHVQERPKGMLKTDKRDALRLANMLEQVLLRKELRLAQEHLALLQTEICAIVTNCREGQILPSIPPIGPVQAATIIATIGNIANFEKASELKSYPCGLRELFLPSLVACLSAACESRRDRVSSGAGYSSKATRETASSYVAHPTLLSRNHVLCKPACHKDQGV